MRYKRTDLTMKRKPNKLTAWGRVTLVWAVFKCQIDGRFAEWRST